MACVGPGCTHGTRIKKVHLLSESVLPVWAAIDKVLTKGGIRKKEVQVIRVEADDGRKLIGVGIGIGIES
jgi:hypothetical protein